QKDRAAAHDGNVWFTEPRTNGNRIGRITPAGVITEFDLPTANSSPTDITAGPDGNLWFTEWGNGKIGRITPDGAITEFGTVYLPSGITAGPDGNVWFTESGGGRIDRITPDGVITQFPLPAPYSEPGGIAAGPDGNIWFTEEAQFYNRIGVFSPLDVNPVTITATEGKPFSDQEVAWFRKPILGQPGNSHTATIDWGDGTPTSTVTPTYDVSGIYLVKAGHT